MIMIATMTVIMIIMSSCRRRRHHRHRHPHHHHHHPITVSLSLSFSSPVKPSVIKIILEKFWPSDCPWHLEQCIGMQSPSSFWYKMPSSIFKSYFTRQNKPELPV
jgi:hypothetical protein